MTGFEIAPIDLGISTEAQEGRLAAQETAARPSLETPFHARTSALNVLGRWSNWAGYRVPTVLRDLELEYSAIRNAATLFDLSPMKKYLIAGPNAEDLLNRVTVRDVAKLAPGLVQYTLWCDDDGKVLDDGTLFRFPDATFMLCAQEHHFAWLVDAGFGLNVTVEDISEDRVGLALQGPTSFAVLVQAGLEAVAPLRPFQFGEFHLPDGIPVMVSRTGFTGDLGYEFWLAPEGALQLWDTLWEAGRHQGITAIGNEALNVARIEAGFIMTNADFIAADQALRPDRRRSPFEIGLSRLVDFEKGHFNGRRALQREFADKTSRWRLVGLDIAGNKPAHQSLVFVGKKREIGHVTAAVWSPASKRNVALASLREPFTAAQAGDLWVEIYRQYELQWVRLMERAQIVERPFWRHQRRRQTPPALF